MAKTKPAPKVFEGAKLRRKPDSERKKIGKSVWFTGDDWGLVARAAEQAGDPPSHWMRKILLKAAKSELDE